MHRCNGKTIFIFLFSFILACIHESVPLKAEEGGKRLTHSNIIGPGTITVFGDPFLSPGSLHPVEGMTLFGSEANSVRPRLDVYGKYTMMPAWNKTGNENAKYDGMSKQGRMAQFAHSMELEANLQLTGTERIHSKVRPIDSRQLKPSIYRFRNNTALPNNQTYLDLQLDTLWFEGDFGEIFDFIDPKSKRPLDLNIAFGLIPITLQDSYLMWDEMLGATISKNNIYLPEVSNLNLMFFAGIDKIDSYMQRPYAFANDKDALLLGGSAYIDWNKYYIEATLAYLEDKGRDAVSEFHIALSATRTFGLTGVSARVFLNVGDESRDGDGQMYILETNHPLPGEHTFYLNAFYGTKGWNPISSRNTMRRMGTNFFECPCGIPQTVNYEGIESSGGASGIKFHFLDNTFSVNPEVAYVNDLSPINNDQLAIATEVSKKVSSHIYLMGKIRFINNSRFADDYSIAFPITFKF